MFEGVLVVLLGVGYTAAFLKAIGIKLFQPWLSRAVDDWFDKGLDMASRERGIRFERRRSRSVIGERGDYRLRVWLQWRPGRADEEPIATEDLCASLACDRIPMRVAFLKDLGAGTDILTGDARFDDAVLVKGEPTILAAFLDQNLRDRLRQLVAWDGKVEEGEIHWEATTNFAPGEIPRALKEVVELADLLTSQKGGVCERLARNVQEDAEAGVRLWNLTLLQQQFSDRTETAVASRAGLADSSPWVRLEAARALPVEGIEVLKGMLAERQTPDHAAAEATALLAARLPADEAGPLLVTALKGRTSETRRQAIQELGRLKHAPALGPLCVMVDRSGPRDAAAAATALGALGDPAAERHLLDAVGKDAAELRVAAARALGVLGSVRAVEPLLAQLSKARLDAETRQALRDAVNAIQSRLAGAEAGQLSLVTTSAEAGRLSLATPKAGPGDVSLVPGRDS